MESRLEVDLSSVMQKQREKKEEEKTVWKRTKKKKMVRKNRLEFKCKYGWEKGKEKEENEHKVAKDLTLQ